MQRKLKINPVLILMILSERFNYARWFIQTGIHVSVPIDYFDITKGKAEQPPELGFLHCNLYN